MATKKIQTYKTFLDHFRFFCFHNLLPTKMTYGILFILYFCGSIASGWLLREYRTTVLSRMKGSFSVDLENTLTEICLEGNGSLMIVRWFCFRISVALTPLSASVLFVRVNTLFYGIFQLEVSSMMHPLGRKIFLPRFDRSHTFGTHYLQCGFLQLKWPTSSP